MGWYRTGSDACYFKNQIMRAGVKPFWTLTFVIGTMYDKDTLYLAHCFPYRSVGCMDVLGREGGHGEHLAECGRFYRYLAWGGLR